MSAFPTNQYRILADKPFAQLQELLLKQNPMRNFSLEDGVIKDRMNTRSVECIPFSQVKEHMPAMFVDFEYGNGVETFLKSLVGHGVPETRAKAVTYAFYRTTPPWVVLPASILDQIPSKIGEDRLSIEPELFDTINGFADWMEALQAKDPVEPKPVDPKIEARRAPLLESRTAFKESYMLFSDETYDHWHTLVSGKPDRTHVKKLSAYAEPVTFHVDEAGKMTASSPCFPKGDKECLSSTAAQPHMPEALRGFRFGEGTYHFMERLVHHHGMDEEEAEEVCRNVYGLIGEHVMLPDEAIDALCASVKEKTMAIPANLILKAHDFEFWLED
jgi:hypothetical protein